MTTWQAVYLRILSTSTPHYIMYETRLTVDQAYEVTNLIKYLPQAVDESTSHIQAILHNMFYEHDTDRNGSLSYEELEVMMRKLGLGISQEDLVKLIAEADSDENGKVDYKEFVNIAAGMLQTFRAKSLANICHNEKAIDDLVEGSISLSEVDKIAGDCVMLLKQSDSAHQGALPAHLIKRRLMRATALGLSPNEITVLCQSLTRNSNGLCVYDSIPLVLYDVRFSCMKSVILESQSSNISEQLSARFQLGIEKLMEIFPDSFLIRTGNLSIRHVVEIMLDIPNLPLSRIQVIMIISEANVVEDSINVSQFIPVAARYIDQMFDPKVLQLKVGAVSAEVPLNGEDGMAMHRRLLLLFKAFDLDFNGTLSYRELTECVKSLNLDISPKQIKALVACAFADSTESALRLEPPWIVV
jgi:Ca2+-binding EF-hand superfamily protein